MIDRALLDLELMDCRAQRDQAQQQLNQANQSATIAQQNILGCSFVERQLLALIGKLEKDEKDEADLAARLAAPVPVARRVRRKRNEPNP